MTLKFVVITDGTSDAALIPIISHYLGEAHPNISFIGDRADLFRARTKPKTIYEKIMTAIDLYEPDLIFVHRDCENMDVSDRSEEIGKHLLKYTHKAPILKILPLRMTETWLLIDERAIRYAVGNPNGTTKISLPSLKNLEKIPNPKALLEELLKKASELRGRRLQHLNTRQCIQLIPKYITDFSPLLNLSAFQILINEIKQLKLP